MKYLKILILFLSIGFLNTIVFIEYLKGTGMPGGEVGMAPFGIMLASAICLIVSLILYSLNEIKQKMHLTEAVLLYQIIYLLILIVSGTNPLNKELEINFQKMYLWIYLISFIVTIVIISIIVVSKELKKKMK